jgi:arylsulfatase A-like enzyme
MNEKKNRCEAWRLVSGGLLVGGVFGVADGLLLALFSRLGFDEAFLETVTPPGLSVTGCVVVLFSVAGAALNVVNAGMAAFASRLIPKARQIPPDLETAVEITVIMVAARALTRAASLSMIPYVCGAAAALLLILAATTAVKNPSLRRAASWAVASVLVLVMAYPYIGRALLRAGFRAGNSRSGRPNILLLVLDTVRADALSAYNRGLSTTPNIDRLAAEGRLYLRAISPAPWTLPTHASMFTGLYPSQHGAVWDSRYLDESFLTLAEILSQLGYRTAGFVENPFVSVGSGLAQGFGNYDEMYVNPRLAILPRLASRVRQKLSGAKGTQEYTKDTIGHLETWLLRHARPSTGKPFFAFLNFMAAHLPNYPRHGLTRQLPTPEELRRIEPVNEMPERFYLPQYRLGTRELEAMKRLYLGDVAYLDSCLGDLFEFLKATGILDETIVIVTSDHGENFGDHGLIEHQFCLYNSLLHVPLIIRFPKLIPAGGRYGEIVSTIFLFRSILDWAGAPDRPEFRRAEEESLARPNNHPRVYAEHENSIGMIRNILRREAPAGFDFAPFDKSLKCVFDGGRKLIWSSKGSPELYDLDRDWEETADILAGNETAAAGLRAQLEAWEKELWRMPREARTRKLDRAAEDALRSLGYIR